MSNIDISNLEYALNKIRSVKEKTLKKSMDKIKYSQLNNCENSILNAIAIIYMINDGSFDRYYNE